jgi:hypothetical protein
MYHFKNLLTAIFFVPFLMANPVSYNEWDGEDGHYPRDNCITDSAATKLASIWENLYVNFDVAVAKKYLAPDLRVISDSINFLVVAPLKNATVGNYPAFQYSSLGYFLSLPSEPRRLDAAR